jgi:hypothetical protein
MEEEVSDGEEGGGRAGSQTAEVESEDLDGIPLDGAALLKSAYKHTATPSPPRLNSPPMLPPDDVDIDGIPSK